MPSHELSTNAASLLPSIEAAVYYPAATYSWAWVCIDHRPSLLLTWPVMFSALAIWFGLLVLSSVVQCTTDVKKDNESLKPAHYPSSPGPTSSSVGIISSSTSNAGSISSSVLGSESIISSASASVSSQALGPPSSAPAFNPPPRPTGIVATKNPKRGLAFAASDSPGDIVNANQSASVISWQYNWANIPPAYLATSNLPFIPMQWGAGAIENFVDTVRAQGADTILGYNEPDFANESNMDPEQAASLWMTFIEPLKEHGVRLGGPAVTAAGTGRPWLQRFFQACSNCTIDFLPVHWYGVGVTGFYDYLWAIHNDYPDLPIWVTEYADTSSNVTGAVLLRRPALKLTRCFVEVYNFMNETIRYLDETEWVERYAWFGFFRPEPNTYYNMLREDGGFNALGELYFEAGTVHTHIITDTAFAGYKTLNGADSPSPALVTSWPAIYGSGAYRGWNILGTNGAQLMFFVVAAISCSMLSASWI
ncbi:hypothetical protein FA15DRAFT_256539 [Coprinopsis marcescibilis]|uniref:Asl1-like glycosyl hydrolase catalytic domain-containing protein n=1 Tax=Coprinopsis marcescibilis TaxID=230819 RepID=A0A5C3LE93_COPMA|nr:hypothetical protein FA15DRAFT_256539 [Coprinopsis marcescibilis]